jgi:hypothetical protein
VLLKDGGGGKWSVEHGNIEDEDNVKLLVVVF